MLKLNRKGSGEAFVESHGSATWREKCKVRLILGSLQRKGSILIMLFSRSNIRDYVESLGTYNNREALLVIEGLLC